MGMCGCNNASVDDQTALAVATSAAQRDAAYLLRASAPTVEEEARWARADWRDPSPHREAFIDANGQRLHYLDWGGSGPPLVFLPGMGHSAHVFDALAPRFVESHHVLALTLRGHGASSAPDRAYTVDSLASDTRAALGALRLANVTLVGHSLGGHVANRVAAMYPAAVARVVYLDAAKDSTGLAALRAEAPTTRPTVPDSAFRTLTSKRATYRQLVFPYWSDALEADLRAQRVSRWVLAMPDLYALGDWHAVRQPQLDVCGLDQVKVNFPWLSTEERAALASRLEHYVRDLFIPWERKGCERFARDAPEGTLVVVRESNHYVFLVTPDQTYEAVSRWLGSRR
jgi:pimeloyl-ACP methyl ester carboxylesterase